MFLISVFACLNAGIDDIAKTILSNIDPAWQPTPKDITGNWERKCVCELLRIILAHYSKSMWEGKKM